MLMGALFADAMGRTSCPTCSTPSRIGRSGTICGYCFGASGSRCEASRRTRVGSVSDCGTCSGARRRSRRPTLRAVLCRFSMRSRWRKARARPSVWPMPTSPGLGVNAGAPAAATSHNCRAPPRISVRSEASFPRSKPATPRTRRARRPRPSAPSRAAAESHGGAAARFTGKRSRVRQRLRPLLQLLRDLPFGRENTYRFLASRFRKRSSAAGR